MKVPERKHSRGNHFRRIRRGNWLHKKRVRNEKRRQVAKNSPRKTLRDLLELNEFTQGSIIERPNRSITILLPKEMDFETHYENTCSHLALLRSAVGSKVRIASLDFGNLKRISTSAALALASEVDRWKQLKAKRLKAAIQTWDAHVQNLLHEMGYFELLEIPPPASPSPPDGTVYLRFKRGESGPNNKGGEIAQQLRAEIEQVTDQRIKKLQLFGGLSEAITNVGHHAYGIHPPQATKQWWVSASYKPKTQELKVTFYDHGRGIPITLPSWKHFSVIRDLFPAMSHSEKIASAVKLGTSSTHDEERGQGLQNLLEFSRAYEDGKLTIYSLRGKYQSIHSSGQDVEGKFEDHQKSIGGTLIEWSVTIKSGEIQ